MSCFLILVLQLKFLSVLSIYRPKWTSKESPALNTSKSCKLPQVEYEKQTIPPNQPTKVKWKVLKFWTFLFLPQFAPHYDQCLQESVKEGINWKYRGEVFQTLCYYTPNSGFIIPLWTCYLHWATWINTSVRDQLLTTAPWKILL